LRAIFEFSIYRHIAKLERASPATGGQGRRTSSRPLGAVKNVGGQVEEAFGRATGDAKSQIQGVVDQAQGTAENLYGQAKDAAGNAVEGLRKTTSSFEDIVRHTIEDRSYTAVAIAFGLGWLFGRTHRPL
jgi:uncharacterized protein YjbJ (UPF0337 family)